MTWTPSSQSQKNPSVLQRQVAEQSVNPDEAMEYSAAVQGAVLTGEALRSAGLATMDSTPLPMVWRLLVA